MQKELRDVLDNSRYVPDPGLSNDIWENIVFRENRKIRLKLWTFAFIGFSSLAGLFPVIKTLLNDLSKSGFYEYMSLAFSNNGALTNYWKDFLLLLGESMPSISILFSLFLVFIFLLSVKFTVKQISKPKLLLSF